MDFDAKSHSLQVHLSSWGLNFLSFKDSNRAKGLHFQLSETPNTYFTLSNNINSSSDKVVIVGNIPLSQCRKYDCSQNNLIGNVRSRVELPVGIKFNSGTRYLANHPGCLVEARGSFHKSNISSGRSSERTISR